jgi:XTP/dITP diphosphohydrolase
LKEILFATKNKDKLREVRQIAINSELLILSLNNFSDTPDVLETGNSFEENAVIKAKEYFNIFKIPCLTDDSGLMVEQLNNQPGIFSARYARENATDEDNNIKLISELNSYSEPHKAKYYCVAVYVDVSNIITAHGEILGTITKYPKGKNGFGYDPYFIPKEYDCTMAELDADTKNKISHRFQAFNKLFNKLKSEGVLK